MCATLRLCAGLLAAAAVSAGAADRVFPAGRTEPESVFFTGFHHGKFRVLDGEGHAAERDAAAVGRLELEKPRKATVDPRGGRTLTNLQLLGYEAGQFLFLAGAQTQKMPLARVQAVLVEADFTRSMDDLTVEVISRGEEVDLAPHLGGGKATIVHFHTPDGPSSTRQGSYGARRARDSKGALRFVRVVVPDLRAPVLRQYPLTTLPQFWFYDRQGGLVKKLADRYTEQDLDDAIARALGAPRK